MQFLEKAEKHDKFSTHGFPAAESEKCRQLELQLFELLKKVSDKEKGGAGSSSGAV